MRQGRRTEWVVYGLFTRGQPYKPSKGFISFRDEENVHENRDNMPNWAEHRSDVHEYGGYYFATREAAVITAARWRLLGFLDKWSEIEFLLVPVDYDTDTYGLPIGAEEVAHDD